MRARLRHILSVLGASYWFLPLAMMAAGVGLAALALALELNWQGSGAWSWIYAGGSEGARELLSTIAASVITVGGVAFSITVMTLTQASSQFGPRLLRNFMRDRHNQVVLGVFVGTFVYCLFVLRTIRSTAESSFVPQVAVTGAFGLGLICMAVLVSFLHHTARTLQAPIVIASLGRQLRTAVQAHLRPAPNDDGEPPDGDDEAGLSSTPGDGRSVESTGDGYVQVLDEDGLLRLAKQEDLVIRLDCRPGDFVVAGAPLLTTWPDRPLSERLVTAMRRAFIMGEQPTEEQDVLFVIRQLAEIASRALSPALNNPYTAVGCLDWLAGGLREAVRWPLSGIRRRSDDGRIRLIMNELRFEKLVDAAFSDIRRYGATHPPVMIALLDALCRVAGAARRRDHLAVLWAHVEQVRETCERNMTPTDRAALLQRYQSALRHTARPAGQAS